MLHTLPELLARIEGYAFEHPFPAMPPELYEPCAYMMGLGGKRLRPALLLMGCELFSEKIDHALPAAWAVELFHNFTLMHDDIMDAAPLRRGQPTVHTKWNLNTGILSGDVLLIEAYRALSELSPAEKALSLIRVFNRVATEVCEGQQLDLNFETRQEVSLEAYLHMIELKTAVLLGGALEMGALAADAPAADARHLYHFGRLAGIAFQLQDDLLDAYGDPEKFGKQVGGDILQNKKTFLVLKTLEVAPPEDRNALTAWMQTTDGHPDTKVAAVRALFDNNQAPERLRAEKERFQNDAFAHLDAVQVPEDRKSTLRSIVQDLLDRDF